MLRVMPEYTLEHVLRGEKKIQDIIIRESGISLVPGATGITDFNGLELTEQHRLIQAISALEEEYDYILVDTSAGIHENVLSFIEAAHQCLLVISPEPTSLTDTFSLVRVLHKRGYRKRFNIVVNSTISELAARKIYKRFSMAVAKYIGCKIAYLGFVVKDDQLVEAICAQSPVIVCQPSALSSQCFVRISKTISKMAKQAVNNIGLSVFWKKELSTQMPDFKHQKITESDRLQYVNANRLTKRQLIVDHKHSMLDFIDDPDMTKEEVDETMQAFMDVYMRRFDTYPVDTVKALNHSLGLNKVSQKDISELLNSLQLFYKDDFGRADKDASAQYLCQLVNSFVEQHGSFPFDPIYALYQAIDMDDIEDDKISHLLITLNLIYQTKNKNSEYLQKLSKHMVYCAGRNNDQLKELTELLQQKYLTGLEKIQKPEFQENNKNIIEDDKAKSDGLLDSIRYASLIE